MYQLYVDADCVYDKAAQGGRLPVARELCELLTARRIARPGALEALVDDVADEPAFCTWVPPRAPGTGR